MAVMPPACQRAPADGAPNAPIVGWSPCITVGRSGLLSRPSPPIAWITRTEEEIRHYLAG